MEAKSASHESPPNPFRLLLWLKFRLIRGAFRKDASTVIGTILMLIVMLPISFGCAWLIYTVAKANPTVTPFLTRDVLTAAYFFWILTPLFGFSMNESYDPTKLFVYPVRYQTIFAANLVGSLFEISTLLFVPVLVVLLLVSASSPVTVLVSIVFLLLFLLQTIATGQALTLLLIGVLKSRRFRDILTVLIPLLALSRYLLTPRFNGGTGLSDMLSSNYWRFADFIPPGWTSSAIADAATGQWAPVVVRFLGMIVGTGAIVSIAVVILQQLFIGERGTSLSAAKSAASVARIDRHERIDKPVSDRSEGALGQILALAGKEWTYVVRDPQYKALAMNIVYVMIVWAISFSQSGHGLNALMQNGSGDGNSASDLIRRSLPMSACALLMLMSLRLTFNIFGGEGAAITLLLSFPVRRRDLVLGKNLAYGVIVLGIEVFAVVAISFLLKTTDYLPLYLTWIVMATLVLFAAGNIVSILFPTKFVVRGGRLSQGGQLSLGASRSPGAGCSYMLLYLACAVGALIAELPAAAAVILPSTGLISPIWYAATIPFGIIYSAGLYLLSIVLIDSWMVTREAAIIAKLAPGD